MPSQTEKIFLIDTDKCDACRECVKACARQHFGVEHPEYARIRIEEFQAAKLCVPVFCQACEDSPCIKTCPMNTRIKLDNGSMVTDEERCIGCRTCVYICPTGAPIENPLTGKLMTCDRCGDDNETPLCVRACEKQKALQFIKPHDIGRKTARGCAARMKKAYKPPAAIKASTHPQEHEL